MIPYTIKHKNVLFNTILNAPDKNEQKKLFEFNSDQIATLMLTKQQQSKSNLKDKRK